MIRDIFWKPYSHLVIIGDNANWAIDEEARQLKIITEKMGVSAHIRKRMVLNVPQMVHYTSQFSLNDENIYKSRNRISVDYFHGKPEQGDNFKKCFESLKKHHKDIAGVRVSTKEMEEVIKSSGIDPKKIARIPIGVDTEIFKPKTKETQHLIREKLNIPEGAMVIGSFQKDGIGWGEGLEPKLIKGPDIFIKVIEKLKKEIPNIHVLLSGPARGFVKTELTKLGVPFTHQYYSDYKKVADLYDALDLYIITSSEEGGPKACLESMAKGVPLVTTEVGQCKDLIVSGENALMAEINNTPYLVNYAKQILTDKNLQSKLTTNGLKTAEINSYNSQLLLWAGFLKFNKIIP